MTLIRIFKLDILTYSTYFRFNYDGILQKLTSKWKHLEFRSEMESLATFSMVLIGSLGIVD